uniref:Luteinizing hormone beta n=1 Tax=Arapaima gigas TaxID=113544 RepID=A0A219LUF5_ARAGI|nr:luteinizing hormone beta [Arapaima gigas]
MSPVPACTLLTFLSLCHLLAPTWAVYLQPCEPINQTISVEKEGCPKCLVFQTTTCSGHCITKEPVYKSPLSMLYQHVCTYRGVRYETIRLPDCPRGVDPHVTYPVALSCSCGLCTMDTSDCTIESLQPDFCINQRTLLFDY